MLILSCYYKASAVLSSTCKAVLPLDGQERPFSLTSNLTQSLPVISDLHRRSSMQELRIYTGHYFTIKSVTYSDADMTMVYYMIKRWHKISAPAWGSDWGIQNPFCVRSLICRSPSCTNLMLKLCHASGPQRRRTTRYSSVSSFKEFLSKSPSSLEAELSHNRAKHYLSLTFLSTVFLPPWSDA